MIAARKEKRCPLKKLIVVLVLLALAGGGYYYWKTKMHAASPAQGAAAGAGPGGAMPPQEVGIVTIAPQAINFTKDLPGRTSPYKIAEIRPQVSGIITKRLFEEGSEVTEGQQLYQIDPASYQAAYNSANADVMKANASLKSAQAAFTRNAELVKVGAVSKQTFDDQQASLDQAKADVAIARAALATAKINVDYTKVFSPIKGRVGKSLVTEGALVTAGQANALATVQQLDPIYVDVTQSSSELMALRRQLGANDDTGSKTPVTLLLEGDAKIYDQKGELQFSDVTVDPTTGTVQLRILFPNPQHELLPGLFVRARIEQARDDNAIVVSQKAISRKADGTVTVWLVGDGDKIALQPITVSQTVGDQWLVTGGLKAGDRVVVEGIQKVAPDAVVKPVEIQTSAQQPDAALPAAQPPAQSSQPPADQQKTDTAAPAAADDADQPKK